jgi:hypothetical protein
MPGQFNAATGAAGMGAFGSLNAGNQYNQMATNPYAQQAFMSPYIQNALQPQLEEMQRQYGITGTQQQSQATQRGAFGGGREAIMAAENERNKNMAMNQAIGQGYQKAFESAQQAQQFGANLGLQGLGQGIQGAGQLANIGQQQLAAQQGILGTQNQMGTQQQQNEQNVINQAMQNYANQQSFADTKAANIMNLVRSTPTTQTQTQYQAPPSAISQAAGLGTAGIAGYKLATMAKGGEVKSFDVGGRVESNLYELPTETLAQIVKNTQSETVRQTGAAILKEREMGTKPPTGYAPGGIVAFADGGDTVPDVQLPDEDEENEEMERARSMIGNPMGEMMMPELISRGIGPVRKRQETSSESFPKRQYSGTGGTFDKAMQFVFPHEGGYVNHPNDRGGPTNMGVTQNTLSGYLGRPATIEDVKNLDQATARDVYKKLFFDPIAKKLDDPKAQMVAFNASIASGPGYADKLIAKHKGDPYGMLKEHTKFMVEDIPRNNPSQQVFVKGWGNRQRNLGEYIENFANGGEVKGFSGEDESLVKPDGTRYANKQIAKDAANIRELRDRFVRSLKNTGEYITSPIYSAGKGIVEFGQKPLGEQYKQYYPEKYANAQAEDAARNGMIQSPKVVSPNAPNAVWDENSGSAGTIKRQNPPIQYTEEQFNKDNPPSIVSRQPAGPKNPVAAPQTQGIASLMGPPKELMGEEPAQTKVSESSKEPSFRDYMMQEIMGGFKNREEGAKQDRLLSLLSAGLGIMGGTSPNAAVNIGQGAQQGIAAHMMARRNQQAEKNALMSAGIGLENQKAKEAFYNATIDQQRNNMIAQAQAQKEGLLLKWADLGNTEEERKRNYGLKVRELDADIARLTGEQTIKSEARQDRNRQFNMSILERMQKDAQTKALAELKLNPINLAGKSPDEIYAITAPKIQEALNNPRYRELHKNTYGYDPYENVKEPVDTTKRKPLNSFQK